MKLTVVLVAAAVLALWVLPFNGTVLTALGLASVWLLREAHTRRESGYDFTANFRALLWAASVFSGLVALIAITLSVLVLMDRNSGWGSIVLVFTAPIALLAAAGAYTFAWYARHKPPPQSQPEPQQPPA